MTAPEHHPHNPADHPHVHGDDCGHEQIQHGDHVDYLHDGHRHAFHVDHYDEHGEDEHGKDEHGKDETSG